MVLQDSLVGTDITEHTLLLLGFSTVMRIFAIVWVGLILGLMPVQGIWSRRKVQKLRPTGMQAYASTVSELILMGAITFAIDWFSDRTGIQAAKNLPSSAVCERVGRRNLFDLRDRMVCWDAAAQVIPPPHR